MSDYSRDNRGRCRKHGCQVLLDEGCELCWEEPPRCCECGERVPNHRDPDIEPYCERCGPIYATALEEEADACNQAQ